MKDIFLFNVNTYACQSVTHCNILSPATISSATVVCLQGQLGGWGSGGGKGGEGDNNN